jgi:hypothetical protein
MQPGYAASQSRHSVCCLEINLRVDQAAESGCPPYFYDTLECSIADMTPSFIGRGLPAAVTQFTPIKT